MSLLDDYICDVTVGNKIFTVTNNEEVLRAFHIQKSINGAYDFRSKNIIDITDKSSIIPTCSLLNINPYICDNTADKKAILNQQVKKAYLYRNIPGEKFSNTYTRDYCNRFTFLREIIQACPFFDLDIYDYLCQDDGAFEYFLESNIDLIQRICISPVHEEVGISVDQLLYGDVNNLIDQVKAFWTDELSYIRDQQIKLRTQSVKTLKDNTEGSLEDLFKINEITKEINYYTELRIDQDIQGLYYVYDIYRYFPFNESDELDYSKFISQFACLSKLHITPINRWHHRQYNITRNLLPDKPIAYTHIEHNDSTLVKLINNKKTDTIREVKTGLLDVLKKEAMQFTGDDNASKAVLSDINQMIEKVNNINDTCNSNILCEVINYWPPILGKMPKSFLQVI